MWITVNGKRKWVSGKKAKRHLHKGDSVVAYQMNKAQEHAAWKQRNGIKPKGSKRRELIEETE